MPDPERPAGPGGYDPVGPRPHEAVSPTGQGGPIDLAIEEAESVEGIEKDAEPRGPAGPKEKARSLWSDAWHELRRNPVFIVSSLMILFLIVISIWPQLIASGDPLQCDLSKSQQGSAPGHPFGYDTQGCDVYTRTVYGARASITVGVCATLGAALLGSALGGLAGFFGGWGTPCSPGSRTSSSASRWSSAAWSSCPSSPAPPSGPSSASSCCSAGRRSPASPAAR